MANLIRYNPFNEVVSLREAMDRLFEDSFIPRSLGTVARGAQSNLYETAEGFTLQIPMPGVNPDDVEITAQQDTLTFKWATSVNVPENATTHWSGFASSQHQQSFTLPTPINAERIEANYENGILTLNLPKAEHAKARTVKVVAKK
ncbi:MAG TPA: Hsp20/alpha crystallin family protein [Ktedonobacteraceae bacterium]